MKLTRLPNKLGHDNLIFGALAGAIIFILIYGILPLNVVRDQWIMNGYIETDIIQHYAGWVNFRNSNWNWPLGYTENLAYPSGTIISYTDSIPWLAIFFKCFRTILPETFQYFGLYVLLCFILQGVSSALLLSEFTENKLAIKISTIIFILSPIMIERAFRHVALASHFLILFSIYLYFHSKNNEYRLEWGYAILLVLAIGIHPYFLPMIFGIFCANIFEMILVKVQWKRIILYIVGTITPCILDGILIGAIGAGVPMGGGGFGYWSMNINAPFNPISCGNIVWSNIFKSFPQILGNIDGFNYLGAGILFGIVFIVYKILIGEIKIRGKWFKQNIGMVIAVVIFYMFAISNVVTYNDKILLEIQLPIWIENLCSIFRASSRMFYPVYYLIILSVLLSIIRYTKGKIIIISLCFLSAIQLYDIMPALEGKRATFKEEFVQQTYQKEYGNEEERWRRISENYSEVRFLENSDDRKVAVFIGKTGMKNVNIFIANRGVYDKSLADEAFHDVINNTMKEGVLYITSDESKLELIENSLDKQYGVHRIGNYWCICGVY